MRSCTDGAYMGALTGGIPPQLVSTPSLDTTVRAYDRNPLLEKQSQGSEELKRLYFACATEAFW